MSATIAAAESFGPALMPVLQRDEGLRGVHALAEEAEAGQERHVLDAGTLAQIFFDLLDRGLGAGIGGVRTASARRW